jgi:hypothetical protein
MHSALSLCTQLVEERHPIYLFIYLFTSFATSGSEVPQSLRLLHTMNVRFSLLDIAQRILGVTLPNFQ